MFARSMPFPEFYTDILESDHGPQTVNQAGNRPRGTFTRARPGNVKLMVVLRNPGQPDREELSLEAGCSGAELAEKIWNYCGEVWDGKYFSRTLSVARREVAELLGAPEVDCTHRAIFTNLVRCTTHKNAPPGSEAIRIGAQWLRREIDLWKPEYIIAYGGDVARGLGKHGIRFDAQLPHPAALGEWLRPGRRAQQLSEVRSLLGF